MSLLLLFTGDGGATPTPPTVTDITYVLNGIVIPPPQEMTETNSTLYAQIRVLQGDVSRKYYGDNKRMWILSYKNTKVATYDLIKELYDLYLNTNNLITWQITGDNYYVNESSVHIDIPRRTFSNSGETYISTFNLILTEA